MLTIIGLVMQEAKLGRKPTSLEINTKLAKEKGRRRRRTEAAHPSGSETPVRNEDRLSYGRKPLTLATSPLTQATSQRPHREWLTDLACLILTCNPGFHTGYIRKLYSGNTWN